MRLDGKGEGEIGAPRLLLPFTLVVVLLVATACGDSDKRPTAAGRVPKVLRIGSDIPYRPFEFGKPPYEGFDVDMVNELARRLGAKVTYEKRPFNVIFQELARGSFDMVATGVVITPTLQKQADFSAPYLPADLSLMIRKGSDIKTKNDLQGKTVGAQLGGTGAAYAKNQTNAQSVRTYALIDDAFTALQAGQVDAVIHDYPVTRYAERSHRNLVVVQAIETGKNYGFAFRKQSRLASPVNDALDKIKRDGTYARIYRKWFGTDPPKGFADSRQGTASGRRY